MSRHSDLRDDDGEELHGCKGGEMEGEISHETLFSSIAHIIRFMGLVMLLLSFLKRELGCDVACWMIALLCVPDSSVLPAVLNDVHML